MTTDSPPVSVNQRRAIVRLDRPPGQEGRVLGVVPRGFQPLQNREGAMIFDRIFGHGKAVYHTGGYLGEGEEVWLLAKLDKPIEIASGDVVEPYALFANSHDGSRPVNIGLTTIRVVCRNTLSLALNDRRFGPQFRWSHRGTPEEVGAVAQEVFNKLDFITDEFVALAKRTCSDQRFRQIVEALFPEPTTTQRDWRSRVLRKLWERRVAVVRHARAKIIELRENGEGMGLNGSRGTFWGALNAVSEYVDHHQPVIGSRLSYALLGEGMNVKVRAFNLIRAEAAKTVPAGVSASKQAIQPTQAEVPIQDRRAEATTKNE